MLKLGLDLGSSYTKGVLVDDKNMIADQYVVKTGFDFKRASSRIIDKFSEKYKITYPVFTCGYGRDQVEFGVGGEPCVSAADNSDVLEWVSVHQQ